MPYINRYRSHVTKFKLVASFVSRVSLLLLLAACASAPMSPDAIGTDPATAVMDTDTPIATPLLADTGTPSPSPTLQTTRTFAVTPIIEETVTNNPPQPLPQNPQLARFVEQARQDLAGRLNVRPDEIDFLVFESVVWPDSSLGCPQPGMAYTQVQRDGYQILLAHAGRQYAYHGGGSRPPFLCENK